METLFISLNLISTLMIAGIFWFIQLVHYPMFRQMPANSLINYSYHHYQKITRIIAPLFVIDLVTLLYMIVILPTSISVNLAITGTLIFVLIILVTQLWFSPMLQKLSKQPNDYLISKLVNMNWIRTLSWTLKGLITIIIAVEIFIWSF
jgi:hypothetical protein